MGSPAAALAPGSPPRLAMRRIAARRGEREVLRGVSLEVFPGEIVGLLGPNGAGKSTLFAVLAGLLRPASGELLLDGAPIAPGARTLRARAGIVFQEPGLDGKLGAEENLRLAAALHRVPRALARHRIARLLADAGLAERAREPVERHRGFLQSVQVGPGSRAALVLGKTLGSASVALTQAALFLLLAPAAGFGYGMVRWPLLLATLLLAAVALAALGFAVAWGLDHVQGYHAVQMTLLVPLWVVSGAMFPAPEGHPGFAAAMRANPLAFAVSAARRALAGDGAPGVLPGSGARDLAVCALFAAAALGVAVLASRRAPRT